jgi:hypothetical protein
MTDITTPPATAPGVASTKSFDGNYLLWRKTGQKLRKGMPRGEGSPKFRHPSFAAAEAEATRLLGLFPESSFVILQEVARVKLVAVDEEIAPPATETADG